MRMNIVFGSDSDEKKVLPGIQGFTEEHEGLEVRVHYASADNTPEKVGETVACLQRTASPRVYISGAGMSNVLTGVLKAHSKSDDLVIGVPITDSKTGGLSSLLSTGEKPPGNPVLMVGLNNSYAALNIGYRFLEGIEGDVVVLTRHIVPMTLGDSVEKLEKELGKIKLPYEVKEMENVKPDDVVLTVFGNSSYGPIREVDQILGQDRGIQIAIMCGDVGSYQYKTCLEETDASGMVGAEAYRNAAYLGAILTRNETALGKIKEAKDEKKKKLTEHKGLIVVNGETRPYQGGK